MSNVEQKWCVKLKKLLFFLLDNDNEVKQKISEVALNNSAKISAYSEVVKTENDFEHIINNLEAENRKIIKEKSDLEIKINKEQSEKAVEIDAKKNLIIQLESSEKGLEVIEEENNALKEKLHTCTEKLKNISAVEEKYLLYMKLPENLRKSLSGIVNSDSINNFLISGSQESRQELFWEFCRTEVQKSNGLTHATILQTLFVFFYNNVLSITLSPIYELYFPIIQSNYNNEKMIPSNSGEQSGHVVQVVLPGIKGIRTNTIFKKAIVKLGN